MAIEIRVPSEDEHEQIATSFSTSLNSPPERTHANAALWPIEDLRCVFDWPIPIGTLSAMFTGFLGPRDAARIGYLDPEDPAVEELARILDGPDPWSPFFF